MAEQAVWRIRRVSLPIPARSLAAVRSRLWMIGPPLLLALLGAVLAIYVPKATFRANAEVFFDLAFAASVIPYPAPLGDSARPSPFLREQARIARSPELARRVVAAAASVQGVTAAAASVQGVTAAWFLRHSTAEPRSDGDILQLSVSHPKPPAAVRLTNAYATEFTRFKWERDVAAINEVIRRVRKQLERLRGSGGTATPRYDALVQSQLQLEAMRVLIANTTRVLQAADNANKVRPHALRNGLIGGAIGLLLGVVLVGVVTRQRKLRR